MTRLAVAMALDKLSDPVGWNTLLHDACRKYELDVEASTSDFSHSLTFLKEKMVMFTIKDQATPDQLMSFKTRVRGMLKVIGDYCTKIAEHFNVDVYVASTDGQQREAMIKRTLRAATPEERAAGKPPWVSERDPLKAEDLWKEFERTDPAVAASKARGRPQHVIVAFRESF